MPKPYPTCQSYWIFCIWILFEFLYDLVIHLFNNQIKFFKKPKVIDRHALILSSSVNYWPHALPWIVCFITLGIGFSMGDNAPFYVVNVNIAQNRAATSLGIMCVCYSLSSIITPTLSGYIVGLTGRLDVVLYFITALSLSSAIVMFLFHNKNY